MLKAENKMSDNPVESSVTEENVISKVTELMETLDRVKKYNALADSLKKFSALAVGSVIVYFVLTFIGYLLLPASLILHLLVILLLAIPVIGIALGIVFLRKKVNAVRTGEWKGELSGGFPSAIRVLSYQDWDKTFAEISRGRTSYAIYSVLKAMLFWLLAFFAIEHIISLLSFELLPKIDLFGGLFSGLIATLTIYLLLHKDLMTRYKEVQSLDSLLAELRWFSYEFRGAEFKT
jgi:hypothetical protein